MPDPTIAPTSGTIDALESRLDAWGERERSRLAGPAPRFMREVRTARGPSVLGRIVGALALAAVLTLVAYVAFRAAPSPVLSPDPTRLARQPAASPARAFTVGVGRNAEVANVFDLLDAMPQPAIPAAAPTRASDVYCAGCIEELTRI